MGFIKIDAVIDNLDKVLAFVDHELDKTDCTSKVMMQIDIAVEEIFVNIASYAYDSKVGEAEIETDYDEDSNIIYITFKDNGKPYNPLMKEDPDITLSAEKRSIGGLGIYMVKMSMDEVMYKYENDMNVLTIKKTLR